MQHLPNNIMPFDFIIIFTDSVLSLLKTKEGVGI
jgi:hypothetical protein